jgi:hypothetical protein
MNRCGCPEEEIQQTANSPGIIEPTESIVFALVKPLTANAGSVANLSTSKLKARNLSVCRGDYSSYADLIRNVVEPQLNRDPSREYIGYHWAPCHEIRSIMTQPSGAGKMSPPSQPVGAFCVIDDAVDGYPAHAVIGFSKPNPKFWEKHDRQAARGNLLLVLQRRGLFDPNQGSDTSPRPGFSRL